MPDTRTASPVGPEPGRRAAGPLRPRNISPAQARRLVDAMAVVRAGRDCTPGLERAIDDLREAIGPWYDDREDGRQ